MKRLFASALMCLLFSLFATAQSAIVLKPIDSALLHKANAVRRFEETEFIVQDVDKAVYKSKVVYTILNEKGDNFLSFYEWTDKFRKLDDVTITLLNDLGMPIKVYTKKDLSKNAAGTEFADDNILYYMRLQGVNYPMHIQYEYSIKYKGLLNYPAFDIQHPDESIEYAQYKATVPKSLGLRYYNQFTDIAPAQQEAGENITYTWQAKNLKPFVYEEHGAHWNNTNPQVKIAPNRFKMDDYEGEMSSWQSFGNWYGSLASKSLDLDQPTKAHFQSMVAGITDTADRVRKIYQYLQDNFRYVSIQLGIGGFKPFPASFTDAKKYGDCKALSNYMQACLAAVNIKSYQALVNAGDNEPAIDASFPVNRFNHVILCVPQAKDSIWLECTSRYTDFDIPGSFTENRKALLITEAGGVLVNTPTSKPEQNQLKSRDSIRIAEDGSGSIRSTLYCSGEYKFNFVHWLHNEYAKDQRNSLQHYLSFAAPANFQMQWKDNIKDQFVETGLELQMEKIYAIKAGPKLFLNKHPYKICVESSLPKTDTRTKDYYFDNPFIKTDTTVYVVPADYEIVSLPKTANLQCKYGSYVSESHADASGNIVSISTFILNKHIIPAADFQETRKFIGQVIDDQNQKIMISKK